MRIRRAGEKDLEGVRSLLAQVLEVHAQGRPDLFRPGTRKLPTTRGRSSLP